MKKFLVLMAICMALVFGVSQAMCSTVTLKAPTGVTAFHAKDGTVVRPDILGHISIMVPSTTAGASTLTDYYNAGFLNYEQYMMKAALNGDIVVSISPATATHAATVSTGWTRTVTVTLKNAAGEIHTWANFAYASGCSIADTSSPGTASIPSTTLTFVNGVATVVVTGDAQSWTSTTDTLTVPTLTILGFTVTGGTSVETFQ